MIAYVESFRTMQRTTHLAGSAVIAAFVILSLWPPPSFGAATRDVSVDARSALTWLYRVDASAKAIGQKARAVVVFPRITKAKIVQTGKTMDAAFGEGASIGSGDATEPHYFMSRSWALEGEDQSYSVALFIMTEEAQESLAKGGWQLDNDATVAIVDEALPKPATMPRADAYAFVFGQQGVAAIVLVQSSTILPEREAQHE